MHDKERQKPGPPAQAAKEAAKNKRTRKCNKSMGPSCKFSTKQCSTTLGDNSLKTIMKNKLD